ncbi:uncharacterized protein LOC119766279 [Culex quinquefasciatus]|uniref:uncharacterized protein LOC119766279 n=1 Tax=Culex quinquefasciatus TaxID=7176 RepID=UPI0018E337C2|nr:uncharacterized protein LOC119766279 [Culex quinquefasciatus]
MYSDVLGCRFELETDHKPLEAIFAPFSKPCAWMERWVLRLQAYTFKVIYKKGVNNIADSFSRLATTFDANEFDGDNSYLILLIAGSAACSAAIDTGEIEEASYQDEEFPAVRESLVDWYLEGHARQALRSFQERARIRWRHTSKRNETGGATSATQTNDRTGT